MVNYAFDGYDKENMARAYGRNLPISTKYATEICKFIRGKNAQKVKTILENVMQMKQPIPFGRFTNGLGHKRGMGPGRYPVKACENILMIVQSAEMNAQQKGLNTANLIIKHVCAHTGTRTWRYGRHRRQAKQTNIEVVVAEKKESPKEKPKKENKGETKK